MDADGWLLKTPWPRCRICRRLLKNPLSVRLGIGPVCRAKDNIQLEFDFMRAQFEVLKHEGGKAALRL